MRAWRTPGKRIIQNKIMGLAQTGEGEVEYDKPDFTGCEKI